MGPTLQQQYACAQKPKGIFCCCSSQLTKLNQLFLWIGLDSLFLKDHAAIFLVIEMNFQGSAKEKRKMKNTAEEFEVHMAKKENPD